MPDKTNNDSLFLRVRKIKVISFHINEKQFAPGSIGTLRVEMQQSFGFLIDLNLVELILTVFYRHPDSNESEPHLVQIQVQNIFEISDLHKFYINNEYVKLPGNVIASIVGLSVSHTRALLSQNLLGTVFQEEVLAIMNSEDIARHFYPYMFDDLNPKNVSALSSEEKQ